MNIIIEHQFLAFSRGQMQSHPHRKVPPPSLPQRTETATGTKSEQSSPLKPLISEETLEERHSSYFWTSTGYSELLCSELCNYISFKMAV